MKNIKVIVDYHEPTKIAEQLKKKGFDVEIQNLEIGDYVLPDYNLGIERKSSDFQNIGDVIMKSTELSKSFKYHYLLVEDNFPAVISKANRRIGRNMYFSFIGATASLSVRGTPPLFLGNQTNLINVMSRIFDKISDGKDRLSEVEALRPVPKSDDIAIRVLTGFEGIGRGTAEKILEHYHNLYEFFNTDMIELTSIKGIGKEKANKIWNIIHGKRIDLF